MSRPFTKPMSRDEVMSAIMESAGKLGHTPSQAELMKTSTVSQRQIVKQFGTYTRALRACNLERQGGGNKLAMDALFSDWATVVRTLKKIPSKAEFEHLARHSDSPLKTRFGSWGQVPRGLKRYIEDQGRTEECQDLLEIIDQYERGQDERDWGQSPVYDPSHPTMNQPRMNQPRLMKDRPVYGPLLRPYPLIHGPMNEAGVIYLFGTQSERLGFVVTRIQKEFPDCEAMRLVGEDLWQRVLIEFEHESRNFLRHMHDPRGCDIIVCWKHNWPECPLEVVELRNLLPKLP